MAQQRRQRKRLLIEPKITFSALNQEQDDYLNAIDENDIVIALGPAGTGKTCCAAAKAAEYLNEERIDRIVVARSSAQSDDLGFLPGSEVEKISPALNGILAELSEFLDVKKEIDNDRIEITSLAYMKGRTFKNAFVILEEAQNCTYSQLKMFITRIGKNAKMIISGDDDQSDLVASHVGDFPRFVNQLSRIATPENGIEVVTLVTSVRHKIIDIILGVLD